MKNKAKLIMFYLLGLLSCGGIVYAIAVSSSEVSYDNTLSGLKDVNNNDVNNVKDAIDALYAKVGNQGSGAQTSNIINNFSITNSELVGLKTTISINGEITTTDSSSIGGYIIVVNNEVKAATTTLPYVITLDKGQENVIKVRAIDKDGNIKESTNSVSITTPDLIKDILDYPTITPNGWINVKYTNPDDENDITYDLDLTINCTANDALDNKAYDGDETTYVEVSSGKKYFKYGSDINIYYILFKTDATSGYLYMFDGGGIYVGNGESELYDGYYHTACYGKNSTKFRGQKVRIDSKMYEIKYDSTIS